MRDDSSNLNQEVCDAMIEACTPMLYANNAFRIAGLPVEAPPRQINRRIEDLKQAEEFGDAADEHTHAFALDSPPTIEKIREASQRLRDPMLRIVDEFFWFWPKQWGQSEADVATEAIKKGDKKKAFETWRSWLRDESECVVAVAQHNLAVVHHFLALESEPSSVANDLSPSQLSAISGCWRKSFYWWEKIADNDAFWSLLSERIRQMDEPDRLTTGEARRMRRTFPEALDRINAAFALEYASKNKLEHCNRHIRYMRETHKGLDNVGKTLSEVTKPLRMRIHNLIRTARNAVANPSLGLHAANDLLTGSADPLKAIIRVMPADDHSRIDASDSVVETCIDCITAYATATKDWSGALGVFGKFHEFVHSKETEKRVAFERKRAERSVELARYLEPIEKAVARIVGMNSIREKLAKAGSGLPAMLENAKEKLGETSEIYVQCVMLVTVCLRGISLDAWNNDKDVSLAIKAIKLASSFSSGTELDKIIQKDIEQLRDIEKQEEARLAYETCWFCKKRKGVDGSAVPVEMYGDVMMGDTLRQIKWRQITIEVPRCSSCKEAHSKFGGKLGGAAAGAAVGTAFMPIVGTLIGAFIGGAVGAGVDAQMRMPPGVSVKSTADEFPAVKDLKAKGWKLGERPPQ